jgi:hypothetical protein
MNFKDDIKARIESDFPGKTDEVLKMIIERFEKTNFLENDRILRCIIFLADKDIEKLNHYIDAAMIDPRDVMLWAEYTNYEIGKDPKKMRDFNKAFD